MANDSQPYDIPSANQHTPSSQSPNLLAPPLGIPRWKGASLKAELTGDWPATRVAFEDGWLRKRQVALCSMWPRLKLAMRRILVLSGSDDTFTISIPFNKIVKFGKNVHLSEAWALQLVAAKTTVPVSKASSAYKKDGIGYIVMEKAKGQLMHEVWQDMQRQRVIGELNILFDQLRQIPHPRIGTICTAAADDHLLFPYRTPNVDGEAGPFANEDDFNVYLRSGPPTSPNYGKEENLHNLERCVELQDRTRHQVCFTHGDASARNFMIRKSRSGEYHVVALIDFELSGFLPEYANTRLQLYLFQIGAQSGRMLKLISS